MISLNGKICAFSKLRSSISLLSGSGIHLKVKIAKPYHQSPVVTIQKLELSSLQNQGHDHCQVNNQQNTTSNISRGEAQVGDLVHLILSSNVRQERVVEYASQVV